MLWLLVLVMVDSGQLHLVIKPIGSQLQCEASVANIKSTRPSSVQTYECVNIGKMAGLGI